MFYTSVEIIFQDRSSHKGGRYRIISRISEPEELYSKPNNDDDTELKQVRNNMQDSQINAFEEHKNENQITVNVTSIKNLIIKMNFDNEEAESQAASHVEQ